MNHSSTNYEGLAANWQYQLILIIKEKLEVAGISKDQAKDIVGDIAFDFGMLHDQGEIKFEGKAYRAKIAFDDFAGNLVISNEESNLHEYAFGSTSEAYGE